MSADSLTILSNLKEGLEFHQESAKLEFSVQLHDVMERSGIKQYELAVRTGKSEAYISKALRGDANLTIETMVSLVRGAKGKLHFKITSTDSTTWWAEVVKGGKAQSGVINTLWQPNKNRQGLSSYEVSKPVEDEPHVVAA